MPSSRTKTAGVAFASVGVAVFSIWTLWLSTRTNHPVDVPISMSTGHVRTSEFKTNLSALYTIEIQVEKKIPFETLNCLLGTAMPSPTSSALGECPDRPSVLKASWKLTSNGQIVASGSSDDERLGSWSNDSISRILGTFRSQSGQRYVLDVAVLADGSALALGNPRLKVEVHPMFYEDVMVGGAILFFLSFALVVIGAILLVISFIKNRGARKVSTILTRRHYPGRNIIH
jgi:hypothetical protein